MMEESLARESERKATASGSTAAVSRNGTYVYVNDWQAYAYNDERTLYVGANVGGISPYTVVFAAINASSLDDGHIYVDARAGLGTPVRSVSVATYTGLPVPKPQTVHSVITGTVKDPNGNYLKFSYTADLPTSDAVARR